jgi:hypothetical protein
MRPSPRLSRIDAIQIGWRRQETLPMFPRRRIDEDETHGAWSGAMTPPVLLAQYAELLETVWACERAWRTEDRIDIAVRYGARH